MNPPHLLEWLPETLSAAFSGFSVLAAVLIYRRARFDEEFRTLRLGARQIPAAVSSLAADLGEGAFNEIGVEIAQEIRKLLGDYDNGKDLCEVLFKQEHRDNVVQAIYEGVENSSVRRRIGVARDRLSIAEYELKGLYPNLSAVVRASARAIGRMPELCYAPDTFIEPFKEGVIQKSLEDGFGKISGSSIIYSYLGNYFSSMPIPTYVINGSLVEAASRVMNICATTILDASDKDLNKLIKADRRVRLDLKAAKMQPTLSRELIYCLDAAMPLFPEHVKEDLQEARDILQKYEVQDSADVLQKRLSGGSWVWEDSGESADRVKESDV